MAAIREARRAAAAVVVALAVLMGSLGTSEAQSASKVRVEADGTVRGPAYKVPWSSLASEEGRAYFIEITRRGTPAPGANADINALRKSVDEIVFLPNLARQRARYPVTIEPRTIAGVYTEVFTPQEGIAARNKSRVLINLHGGGFVMGARTAGQVESIPIASVGRIKVISVDYRQGPEHKFPAASEDVAKVYRELLKTYKPRNIGIFGCSAGGLLAAQAVAWFDKEKLPQPGAVGIFCASIYRFGGGDSLYIAPMLGAIGTPPTGSPSWGMMAAYFGDTAFDDPLAVAGASTALLAKFPPTLLITGSRAGEMSEALDSHIALTQAGVDSEIFVWDGMPHGFFNNPDLPESREAYELIVRFFDSRLGKRKRLF
jgi:acetyl esterase/lipase